MSATLQLEKDVGLASVISPTIPPIETSLSLSAWRLKVNVPVILQLLKEMPEARLTKVPTYLAEDDTFRVEFLSVRLATVGLLPEGLLSRPQW